MDLFVSEGTDLVGRDLGDGNGPSIKRSEFNLVTVAAVINVNDRSDIANREPVVGEVGGQRHAVQLFDHAGRGYAVMKRGANGPAFHRHSTEFFQGRWGRHRGAVRDGSRAASAPGAGARMLLGRVAATESQEVGLRFPHPSAISRC